MKIKKIYYLLLMVFVFGACNEELMNSIPLVEINPGFSSPGFNDVSLVSLNESKSYDVVYKRVYGISRELTMDLTVDVGVLDVYNQENGTNLKLLSEEFYTIPTSISFGEKEKTTTFSITLFPKKIYEKAGSVEEASTYVIPIKASTPEKEGVDYVESENILLLHVNMLASTITVEPQDPINLYFAKGSEIKESFSIEGTLNFESANEVAVSVVVDDQAVLLNSGDYTLLPEANYSFSAGMVNDYGFVVIPGEINALGLSDTLTYLLPCLLNSTNPDYVIEQDQPVYYVVNISDLKISITNGSETAPVPVSSSISTLSGAINVAANTLASTDLSINFNYDPSLITAFNTLNGENYQTLPEGVVSITNGKIDKNTKSVDIQYSIDLSDLALSTTDHYLVPLVIAPEDFEIGSLDGSSVIYLDVTKSLVGTYDLNIIKNERTRNIGNTIWLASECQRAGDENWDAAIAQAQYGFGGDGDWYAVLFSVTDEDMPGKENCKKIEMYSFLELIESTGGTNNVTQNQSYFNTATGEVYIDCFVYESWFETSYKETYSFTLQ
nr:DUF1735 domain-containing protein [uncultured Draconibacterium sp.]